MDKEENIPVSIGEGLGTFLTKDEYEDFKKYKNGEEWLEDWIQGKTE